MQFLPNGTALAVWFTYPPVGDAAEQAWLIADQGVVEGSKIRFSSVYQPQGSVFGPTFNPDAINRVLWGTLELEVRDCNSLVARYAGPAAFGSGERVLTRLTAIDQLNCNGGRSLTASGARALEGLRAKSGAWYVPSRSGEGWLIEELADGRSVVYWFTYDPQGRQAWTVGAGVRSGNRLDITENVITRGTRFGSGFDAAAVQRVPWGRLSFTFSDCNAVEASYSSPLAGFGSGTLRATRLTALAGSACLDGTPQARVNGTWIEAAAMPGSPQSELAATVLDGKIYALGGFGDPRGFKRYDPASNSWTTLPSMPGGRDHLAAFAFDGGVYYSGGAANGGGEQTVAAFRFDVTQNRWEPRPELQFNFGSHATVLSGRAYIGNEDGTLQEYDLRQRSVRKIERADVGGQRDHSQLVAFLGEIWMIAGRSPENTSITIYDPVTERWRLGPSLARPRGGFAAAVVDDQIVVAGGELISGAVRTEPTVEVYTAGGSGWQQAPRLPVSVHGVAGAGVNGRFYVVSGSTQAASASGATGRLFSIQLQP